MAVVDIDELDDAGFDWEVTKRLAGYLVPHKRNILWAMGAALLSVFANVAGPPLIGFALDEGIRNNDLKMVGIGAVAFLIVNGLGAIGFRIQILLMALAGQRAIQALRDDMFQHVNRLSMAFFTKYETGRLIARIVSDVQVLREAITFAVVGTFRDSLILVGTVIAMVFINLPLTGVAFMVILVLGTIANYWRIHARRTYLRVRETNARVNAELAESFNAVRVTQAFDRQAYNYNRFISGINMDHRKSNVKASLVAALFFPSIELVGGVATGALVYVGGRLVLDESLTVGTLLTFVLYIDQFFFPIRILAQRYNMFQSVMAAGAKIFRLLDMPVDIQDAENAETLPVIQGNVKFENVHFSYNGSAAGERYS
jgi:ABC-type multidrug transport system fused ATPase/permease subunit